MSSTVLSRSRTAPALHFRSQPATVETSLGTISLHLTSDVQSVRQVWEALQAVSPCSPLQTYSAALAWVRHVAEPNGDKAIVVLGSDEAGEPLFLWAFELETMFGQRALTWLAQPQSNYTMGLHDPNVAEKLTAEDVKRLLNWVATAAGASAIVLKGQPYQWGGQINPFSNLPHQPHPSAGYAVTLGDFDELYLSRFPNKESRRKFTRRERKLAEAGAVVCGWAETREEKKELIDIFFSQREKQFAKMGVPDPFTPPVRDFYRDLALLPDEDPARLRLGAIRVGDEVAATFSGAICHNIMAVMMSSLTEGDMQRHSPGLLLLKWEIEDCCTRGLSLYDIGVGAARHKERWCDVVRPLFDCFIPVSPQGLAVTVPLATMSRVKRWVKTNKLLWPIVLKVRKHVFGANPEHDD